VSRELADQLSRNMRRWSDAEIRGTKGNPPHASGVYAWFFDEAPPAVPLDRVVAVDDWVLLYVGISPKEPPRNGRLSRSQGLRPRIRTHFRGNASASTLRLSVGALLSDDLGLDLRCVVTGPSGKPRLHFHSGEPQLTNWLQLHARVAWIETAEPWTVEPGIVHSLSLPLNLGHNEDHPFHATLSARRDAVRERARARAPLLITR
jgi:hypothetical protein